MRGLFFMIKHHVKRCFTCFAIIGTCAMLLLAGGCAGVPERHPLPLELSNQATVADIAEARFWGDEWPKYSVDIFETYTEADFQQHFAGVYKQPHNYLTISGGGANGAFGAGLLAGWAASGKRPEFSMVTGVSTGCLDSSICLSRG